MKRARKRRFVDTSIVPDDEEHELMIGPPDETSRAARGKRVRTAGS